MKCCFSVRIAYRFWYWCNALAKMWAQSEHGERFSNSNTIMGVPRGSHAELPHPDHWAKYQTLPTFSRQAPHCHSQTLLRRFLPIDMLTFPDLSEKSLPLQSASTLHTLFSEPLEFGVGGAMSNLKLDNIQKGKSFRITNWLWQQRFRGSYTGTILITI